MVHDHGVGPTTLSPQHIKLRFVLSAAGFSHAPLPVSLESGVPDYCHQRCRGWSQGHFTLPLSVELDSAPGAAAW